MEADQRAKHQPGGVAAGALVRRRQTIEMDHPKEAPSDFSLRLRVAPDPTDDLTCWSRFIFGVLIRNVDM